MVLLPRLLLLLGGSGSVENECRGDLCDGGEVGDDGKVDYDDTSSFAAGFEALYPVTPTLRIGGGLLYTFDSEVDVEDQPRFEMGSDLSLLVIPELVLHPAPAIFLTLRGQGGLALLFPGGDQREYIDEVCDDLDDGPDESCEVNGGPYVGVTYGAGFGIAYLVEPVRIRADVIAQGQLITWSDLSVEWDDQRGELSTTLAGSRIWLTAGLEL